ncbi:MAG: hypothetical protein D6679_07705 [Candidatus Hydrogenedentota bacterium]|nr:MAG: hypothetical protein D6679_07705 [Candidatus Hydrogenedentota bacterium]
MPGTGALAGGAEEDSAAPAGRAAARSNTSGNSIFPLPEYAKWERTETKHSEKTEFNFENPLDIISRSR